MQVYKVVKWFRLRLYNIIKPNTRAIAAIRLVEVVAPLIIAKAQKKSILLSLLLKLPEFNGKVKYRSSYLELFRLQKSGLNNIDKVTAFLYFKT